MTDPKIPTVLDFKDLPTTRFYLGDGLTIIPPNPTPRTLSWSADQDITGWDPDRQNHD